MSNVYNIALALDRRYLLGAHITCLSILTFSNLDSKKIKFFFLVDDCDPVVGEDLERGLRSEGFEFEVCICEVDQEVFSNFPEFYTPSKMSYARLLLPSILEVDRLLYVDSDLLVCLDIEYIFRSLKDHVAVGVIDQSSKTLMEEIYGGQDTFKFLAENPAINAGIICLSLEKIRSQGHFDLALSHLHNYGHYLRNHDQSAINVALEGKFKILEPKYNLMVNQYHTLLGKNELSESELANFHFVTSHKPWLMMKPSLPFVAFQFLHRKSKCRELYMRQSIPRSKILLSVVFYKFPTLAISLLQVKVFILSLLGKRVGEIAVGETIRDLKISRMAREQENKLWALFKLRIKMANRFQGQESAK